MKVNSILSMVSAVLFFSTPVYSIEISAENIQTKVIQEYNGNARVAFAVGEKFIISSDKSSINNGTANYYGNVVVAFKDVVFKMNSASVQIREDGSSLLEANKIVMLK
ncbi:hypothetical protein [Aeromonas allosaccharophila]|uniref:hypothetical protein n=1 Tax=Aeromonas allosaccharophila TaxID=656 RepID=UPI00128EE233|nr:hypothetical protein [Aeromonas allosaccharophila]